MSDQALPSRGGRRSGAGAPRQHPADQAQYLLPIRATAAEFERLKAALQPRERALYLIRALDEAEQLAADAAAQDEK